ncbi:hypothetical protein M0804_001082 [Polistes exclamans]|nr:hypothetical protein M0804_001082 [Polistes exclamans]
MVCPYGSRHKRRLVKLVDEKEDEEKDEYYDDDNDEEEEEEKEEEEEEDDDDVVGRDLWQFAKADLTRLSSRVASLSVRF